MAHSGSLVLAQDPVRCDLCSDTKEAVEVYCNTCRVKLCRSCMSSHVPQGQRSHDMVGFGYRGSQRPHCEIHAGNTCEIQCQQCMIPVCNKCIVSGDHKNHDFRDICDEFEGVNAISAIEESISCGEIPGQMSASLINPVVVLELDTKNTDLDRIEICQPDKVWMSFLYESTISCSDFSGAVKDSVNVTSGEHSADLSTVDGGELYFCDWKDKAVCKYNINDNKLEALVKLQEWTPRAICVTKAGDVLVCMTTSYNDQCKIIQYDARSIKHEIQFDEDGESRFSHKGGDIFLTENGNKDICVSLTVNKCIVVVNKAGEFRFSYEGNSNARGCKEFSPNGVAADRFYQILIADSENGCIHIIDKEGGFIMYIDNCSLVDPRDIRVNSLNGNLYVGEFSTGKIKIIKYLK